MLVADADGYNQQKLLSSKDPIMSPRWSPDGTKLAYVSFEGQRASIYIQEALTGHRYVVAAFDGINGAPAWSPDSKWVAVNNGGCDIFLVPIGSGAAIDLNAKFPQVLGGAYHCPSSDQQMDWK